MPDERLERARGDSGDRYAHGMRPIYPPLPGRGGPDRVNLREFIFVVGAILGVGLIIGAALRLIIAVAIS